MSDAVPPEPSSADAPRPASKPSIKKQAAAGVRWGSVATMCRIVFMLARLSVLARLLAKRDFGLMSMVTLVLGYAQAYVDLGLSSSLIQKQEKDPDKLSTLFWLNVLAGLAVAALIAALRAPVAGLLKEPELAPLIAVAVLQLPLSALGQQFEALFQRELRFKLVSVVQVATDALNTALAIGLAFAGHGVWSLVYASLVSTSANSLILFVLGQRHWPIRFVFRVRDVTPHLRFGAYQLGNANLGYISSNADNFLIGRLLGAEALGVYSIALRLTQMPRKYINPIISKVAFPVFAKQKDQKHLLASSLLQLQRSLAYVNLPLVVGMLLVAPVLVPVVYSPKWEAAVPLVQILCLAAVLQGIGGPTQIIRTALGHVRFNFHWTWITGVGYSAAMWLVSSYGLTAMVWARVAASLAFGIALITITLRLIDSGLLHFLATVRWPALAVAVMSVAVWLAMRFTGGGSDVIRLIFAVAVGAGTYALTALLVDREYLLRNARLLLGRR